MCLCVCTYVCVRALARTAGYLPDPPCPALPCRQGQAVANKVLVVAPASLVGQWCKEVKKWLGSERLEVSLHSPAAAGKWGYSHEVGGGGLLAGGLARATALCALCWACTPVVRSLARSLARLYVYPTLELWSLHAG